MKYKAFTLIELLVVLSIVGILAGFVFVQTNNAVNSGKDAKRKSDIALLASAAVGYQSESLEMPISSGCSINVDCPTEVNQALEGQIGTLPVDPNSGSSYKYQSVTGTDCTISAVLSTGETYQYSCNGDEISQSAPLTGVCGSAATTYLPEVTGFSGSYCDSGIIQEPSFPGEGESVSWQCPGTYLGESVTCTAYHGKNGVCGNLANTTTTAYLPDQYSAWPSSDFCSTGSVASAPAYPAQGGSSNWTCNALYAGASADCTAYRGKNGVCGTSTGGNYYLSSEITIPCETGTTTISGSGSPTGYFTWSCPYTYSGTPASCAANLKVNGVCGSSGPYSSLSAGVCSPGTASGFAGTGPWTWTCNGLNGGTASGACSGVLSLVNGSHTSTSCASAGGTVVSDGSGHNMCRFNSSSCPSGWTQYNNWVTISGSGGTTAIAPASSCVYATWSACIMTVSVGPHDWANGPMPVWTGCKYALAGCHITQCNTGEYRNCDCCMARWCGWYDAPFDALCSSGCHSVYFGGGSTCMEGATCSPNQVCISISQIGCY